jgi:hypothetical protein
MDFLVGGQWYWETNTAATGMNAMWQNPGGGFGTGCDKYADMNSCLGQGAGDMMFELRGKSKTLPTR